jgi:hypothetical protein
MSKEDKKTEVKKGQYFIAKGFCVTTKRGQLEGETQVFPKDFPKGKNTIDELIKLGSVVIK